MSLSKIDGGMASYLFAAAAAATLLGIAVAYQQANQLEEQKGNKADGPALGRGATIRDRSEGKKVGKEVNLLNRKKTKIIQDDDLIDEEDDDVEPTDVQEVLALELKRHKSRQKK